MAATIGITTLNFARMCRYSRHKPSTFSTSICLYPSSQARHASTRIAEANAGGIKTTTQKTQPYSITSSSVLPKPHNILSSQRLVRPVAPHLGIYKWQITSVLSILHRITGIMFAVPLYAFAIVYVAAPFFGITIDSAAMAASFGALPVAVKSATKFVVTFPFALHCFNGVRHLVWDSGRQMKNYQVVRTGWAVVAFSAASALAAALL